METLQCFFNSSKLLGFLGFLSMSSSVVRLNSELLLHGGSENLSMERIWEVGNSDT